MCLFAGQRIERPHLIQVTHWLLIRMDSLKVHCEGFHAQQIKWIQWKCEMRLAAPLKSNSSEWIHAKITATTSCIPRHHVCLDATRFLYLWRETKQKKRLWELLSERALVTLRWDDFIFLSFLSFCCLRNESDAAMTLSRFMLCSDWLCVFRNRKWRLLWLDTTMTQRLFHDVFISFCTF